MKPKRKSADPIRAAAETIATHTNIYVVGSRDWKRQVGNIAAILHDELGTVLAHRMGKIDGLERVIARARAVLRAAG